MKPKKIPTVEVISVKTITNTADELVVERVMRISGATRLEAEWQAPQSVWALEPVGAPGQRGVRIIAGSAERRGVWLLTIDFIYRPRPAWAWAANQG